LPSRGSRWSTAFITSRFRTAAGPVPGFRAFGGRFALTAYAGYLFVLSAGEITSPEYFPRANANGVEAGLGLGVQLLGTVEARLNVDARRYIFGLNPEPGDPLVAGGAADDYLSLTLGIGARL
jgi:hypothetical protein